MAMVYNSLASSRLCAADLRLFVFSLGILGRIIGVLGSLGTLAVLLTLASRLITSLLFLLLSSLLNCFLGFLYRTIVGTLLEVGKGKLSLEDFRAVIERKDRCSAGESVPAHALFLEAVDYPDADR